MRIRTYCRFCNKYDVRELDPEHMPPAKEVLEWKCRKCGNYLLKIKEKEDDNKERS